MSILSFMMRRGCKKSDAQRDAGLVYPDNVIRVEDTVKVFDFQPTECTLPKAIAYVNENFPPCMIMTSNEDMLREQPATFMKKLEECGVSYVYKFYGDDEQCAYFKTFLS